jgi:DNA polymerase II small subunit/DNA polymerase delta subunit B
MKKVLICSIAVLAILLASGAAQTKEKARGKGRQKAEMKEAKKKMTEEEKQWREKLEAMTPEERRVAMAKRAFEIELKPWQEVRKIAAEEKATKTVAAIDKIITGKQEQLRKKLEAAAKKEGRREGKPQGEGRRQRGDKPRK